jgi:hypothetical protein
VQQQLGVGSPDYGMLFADMSRSDVRSLSRSKYAQFQVARGDADRERRKQRHGIKRARLWRTNRMICYRAAAR